MAGSKTTNTYDACGNLTDQNISIGSGYNLVTAEVIGELSTQHTVSEVNYYGTPSECSDDFVTKNTQTSKNVITGNTKTSSTEFTPNAQKDIATKTVYKGTNIENTTTYGYESNGVVNSIEISAKDIDGNFLPVRKTVFSDFAKGIYPQTTRDVISTGDHVSTSNYDFKFGTANYIKDPNGQISANRFDFLGRLTESFAPDQTHTELISFYCNSGAPVKCPGNAAYGVATRVNSVTTQRLAAPLTIIFYDKFQREVRQSRYTLNGSYVNIAKEYTPEGRLSGVSEPFATQGSLSETSAAAWTRFSDYDALGRARSVVGADGGSKKTTYSKDGINLKTENVITVKNAQGNVKDTQATNSYTNPLGQVARVEDALGTPVVYEYDGAGNLTKTVINGNSYTAINIDYDDAGNKVHISDPDAGIIDFEYNGFGEMRRQTWQKNTAYAKSITYEFDQLGRNTSRIDKSASSATTAFAWVWDTKQKNKLNSVSGNSQTIEYGYDGYSRVSTLKTSITGLADKTFSTTYDEFSRPSTVTYPNGFRIQRLYNNIGLQVQTQDISDAANPRILWAMGNVLDSRGNLTNQLWGNGVATQTGFDTNSGRVLSINSGRLSSGNQISNLFGDIQSLSYASDTLGNLESRTSTRKNNVGTTLENLTESFTYDRLNRLKTSTASGSLFSRFKNYDYDLLGNLTGRSSVSTLGNSVDANEDVGVLSYSQINNAGVHAVTSAGGVIYKYDKYGNMTTRGSETITYDVFNKPTRISGTNVTDILYGADNERFKETSGSTNTYTIAGGAYEEIVTGSVSVQKSYVDGVIINTKTVSGSSVSSNDTSYLHSDHLGSGDAISDSLGAFVTRMSFSDWGNRQLPDWKSGTPSAALPTSDGYTGHHQLDQHKLVHMGGRVYDPNLGRFLSADLFVQSPYSSQSFNRYSYVANNPLSKIDPSGYAAEDITVIEITATPYNPGPTPQMPYVAPDISGISYNYGTGNIQSVSNSSVNNVGAKVGENTGSEFYNTLTDDKSEKNGKGLSLDGEFNELISKCSAGSMGACSAATELLYKSGKLNVAYMPAELKWAAEKSATQATLGVLFRGGTAALELKMSGITPIIAMRLQKLMYGFAVNSNKYNYFFGRVITGDIHNIQRSAQNLKDLSTLGFKTEKELFQYFKATFNAGKQIGDPYVAARGTTITLEGAQIGNLGRVDVKFFYEGGNLNSAPIVSTIIPKIY